MASEALTASLEDYLEAIYMIVGEKRVARVKDIAKRLKVHKSTVTAALHALSDRELVNYVPYEVITLTPEGRRLGAEVARRHETLCRFLTSVLAIDEETAEEAACKMEHAMPEEVVDRFTAFAKFIEVCPRAGARWVRGFGYFCEDGPDHGNCERCLQLTLEEARRHQAAKASSSQQAPTGEGATS